MAVVQSGGMESIILAMRVYRVQAGIFFLSIDHSGQKVGPPHLCPAVAVERFDGFYR